MTNSAYNPKAAAAEYIRRSPFSYCRRRRAVPGMAAAIMGKFTYNQRNGHTANGVNGWIYAADHLTVDRFIAYASGAKGAQV